jgi:hypothetical protein
MSSRFHNKYHRHNHHTTAVNDPRYPDSSHDPIASPESPFLGPFVMYGTLSSVGVIPDNVAQNFGANEVIAGIFVAPATSAVAIRAEGSIQATGGLSISGTLSSTGDIVTTGTVSAANVVFTGDVVTTYSTPVTATGEFLVVNVDGINRAIRLWQYE